MALERRIYSDRRIALSAVSKVVARQLQRFFGREDVEVIRNAVDTRQFNAAARLAHRDDARLQFGIALGDFVFLLIGNDWKKKGLDTLLEALALCSDRPVRLLVVGKDAQEPYQKLCTRLQLEARVKFLPPRNDVLQFYAAADAYVGPSLEDAYGLPIIESMACGLPVIASTAAGASEIISDCENGLLLRDPRDARGLAQLMRRICESSELAKTLGTAAERTAATQSWEEHAAHTYNHFLQILSRKSSSSPL
jgi:UDP-glucose:(heptosyl)LPS alpha-1,3-glucosyltransferase